MSEPMIKIIRPDLRSPDDYQISLDGEVLKWLEDSLLEKASRLHTDIAAHGMCDMRRADGCSVRERWLVSNYGSVEAARNHGYHRTDCSEDLSYLHHALGDVMDFVLQSRYLRQRPGERSYGEQAEVVQQLESIKAEVNHREAAAKSPTSYMDRLDADKLAELEREAAIREQVNEAMRKKEEERAVVTGSATVPPQANNQQEKLAALSQNLRTKTR